MPSLAKLVERVLRCPESAETWIADYATYVLQAKCRWISYSAASSLLLDSTGDISRTIPVSGVPVAELDDTGRAVIKEVPPIFAVHESLAQEIFGNTGLAGHQRAVYFITVEFGETEALAAIVPSETVRGFIAVCSTKQSPTIKEMRKVGDDADIISNAALCSELSTCRTFAGSLFSTLILNDALDRLARLLTELVSCEGATIFVPSADRLHAGGTTGLIWSDSADDFYLKDEGTTGTVWAKGEPVARIATQAETGKSTERVYTTNRDFCLWVPVELQGISDRLVIRARNCIRAENGKVSPFANREVLLLRCVGDSIATHLGLLIEETREQQELGRISHELHHPIGCILSAFEGIRDRASDPYVRKYSARAVCECKLTRLYLETSDAFRRWPLPASGQQRFVYSIDDLVAQAKLICTPRLDKYGLSASSISHVRMMPSRQITLRIAKDSVVSAIACILLNAVSFRRKTRDTFGESLKHNITIRTYVEGGSVIVSVEDTGIGFIDITPSQAVVAGIRGPYAHEYEVSGQGLGLWYASMVAEEHGGTLSISSRANPTLVVMSIPLPAD